MRRKAFRSSLENRSNTQKWFRQTEKMSPGLLELNRKYMTVLCEKHVSTPLKEDALYLEEKMNAISTAFNGKGAHFTKQTLL